MHPNELVAPEGRRHRRQFSQEFKSEVVASCQQRGVSVAAVARAHDLHPNLLRKWVQEQERFGILEPTTPTVRRDLAAQFIPLNRTQLQTPDVTTQRPADITIELQSNGLKASVRWPMDQAPQCAAWLRDVMR